MGQLTVPRWFIKARAMEGGIRLPKLEVKQKHWGYPPRELPVVYRAPYVMPPPEAKRDKDGHLEYMNMETVVNEKFDPGDWRYWGGTANSYGVLQKIECRLCGAVALSKWGRKDHFERHSCGKGLVEAYKLLMRDMCCVICDKKCTKHQLKWGIPFCSEDCIYSWCLWQAKPGALVAAIEIVMRNGAA